MSDFYTLSQTTQLLHCTRQNIALRVKQDKIKPYVLDGTRIRGLYDRRSVDSYANRQAIRQKRTVVDEP